MKAHAEAGCGEIRPNRLPRAKLCCFSAKSDRCTGTARHSDGLNPSRQHDNRGSMKFNIFAEGIFSPFAEIVSRCGEIRSDRSLLGTRSTENREKNRCFYQLSHHSISPSTSELNSNHGGGGSTPPTPLPPHKTLLLLRSSLPRAKKHSFSAKSVSPTSTTRRCVGLRRYKRGGTKFNTFARWVFLRLSRSCRVAEKSDPIDRFSGPGLQKIVKNQWFLSNPTRRCC